MIIMIIAFTSVFADKATVLLLDAAQDITLSQTPEACGSCGQQARLSYILVLQKLHHT